MSAQELSRKRLSKHPTTQYFRPEGLTVEEIQKEKTRLNKAYSLGNPSFGLPGYVSTPEFTSPGYVSVSSDHCRNCVYYAAREEYLCLLEAHSSLLFPPLPEYEATPKGWMKKGE